MKLKILYLSPVPSPFQVELGEAMNALNDIKYFHIFFISPLSSLRAQHWMNKLDLPFVFCSETINHKSNNSPTTLDNLLSQYHYDVILFSNQPLSNLTSKLLDQIHMKQIPLIFWGEQPLPRRWPLSTLKRFAYKLAFNKMSPSAIWAIGDRAVQKYRKISSAEVYLVPYFQSLKISKSMGEKREVADHIRFLFSGQPVKRNNINGILHAVQILNDQGMLSNFTVILYVSGYDCKNILVKTLPSNVNIITTKPLTWDARLTILKQSDILLSPGLYAGWGLTIPEALASGMPVISTHKIESARYYIRDNINGFLCDTSPESIASRMEIFIDNPKLIKSMKEQCIQTSLLGEAQINASRLRDLFNTILTKKTEY